MEENNDQSVTIDIPLETAPTVEAPIQPQTETTNTSETLNTEVVGPPVASVSEQVEIKEANPADRNELGQFIEGNQASVGNHGGVPCQYCLNKDKIQKTTEDYLLNCRTAKPIRMPYIQELADILDCDKQQIRDWQLKKNDKDELEHPDFDLAVKKLWNLQELRLLSRTLGRYNPTGAIFQLKVNHKYIETEKKLLANDNNEPLRIEFVDEKPIPGEGTETSE